MEGMLCVPSGACRQHMFRDCPSIRFLMISGPLAGTIALYPFQTLQADTSTCIAEQIPPISPNYTPTSTATTFCCSSHSHSQANSAPRFDFMLLVYNFASTQFEQF